MATKFQIKRTSISGRTPNTADPANTSYIASGELAINLTDEKLYSSNGTVAFEIGANLANLRVSNTITVGNSTVNTTVNSSVVTTTNVVATNLSGNGASVTSVNAATVGGNTASTLRTYSDTVAATAFSNAAARADSAYSNATVFASNADNISSGTLNTARLPATVNVTTVINVGANVNANTSALQIGNSTVNTTVNSSVLSTTNVIATNLSGNGALVTSVNAATVGGNTASVGVGDGHKISALDEASQVFGGLSREPYEGIGRSAAGYG